MQSRIWELVSSERTQLLGLLENFTEDQWHMRTLSEQWQVRDVVAHLTSAGSTGVVAWLVNMFGSALNVDRHNQRLLEKYLGDNDQMTLENFRHSQNLRIAPLNSAGALLGELVVHGQDIAVPCAVEYKPSADAVMEVAKFFVTKDFAVNSKKLVKGLKLSSNDQPFVHGYGPEIRGQLLDLVMVMAGRKDNLAKLEGAGTEILAARLG
ncbi:maleylpyruvate isomerase family mycothiol-dependent enzyme [Glutamicibacter mishrai]|uniref:maleylpyruvate isomerase family mycothiol-dependent enzyme n=1 Tax=Glutamicibacter mishrai TaxID=1775880 RepID=UPI0003B33E57|nr:maleylpyruvate isomerase family mycothiol-dependent enzyme [Glutamicibacter mishrai]UTT40685.1 maleylpyruvate isomerase family mycothiol-dependent enzyme [Glutamicibacter mishrai]